MLNEEQKQLLIDLIDGYCYPRELGNDYEKFEEHCTDAAKELAKDHNLNPDYYEPFIEFYIKECRESDRGYFFGSQKYIIDLWWDHNKDLYETKTPYIN